MSDYRYETSNERLDIKTSADPRSVFMWIHEGRKEAAIIFPKTDAPTVAAELLKAAGRADLAEYIEEVIEKEAEAARIVEAVSPRGLTRCHLCNDGIAQAKATREAAEKAEAEAAEKKLQERRDALAKEFDTECDASLARYRNCTLTLRRAIDHIIELEDGASRD